jgi:hypothetical protein
VRTYDEIWAGARDEPPFSNGTEYETWSWNWCWRCHQPDEVAWQRYENGERKTAPKQPGCPLILAALLGRTPTEWMEQDWAGGPPPLGDRYHCIEFRGPGDGDGEEPGPPQPRPEPKNMDGLFPRPVRALRMLKQAASRTRELQGAGR